MPTSPPASIPIRYVPSKSPQFSGVEKENPFAGVRSSTANNAPPAGPRDWQIYRVRGAGAPELIYSTHRLILSLEWPKGGATVRALFRSLVEPADAQAANRGQDLWGDLFLELSQTGVSVSEIVPDPPASAILSPDGTRVAVTFFQGRIGDHEPALFVIGQSGNSSKLEGFPDNARIAGWLPDGSALIVSAFASPGSSSGGFYQVPLADGTATLITPPLAPPFGEGLTLDGRRIASVGGGDLIIVDRATGASHRVIPGAGYKYERARWTADGALIVASRFIPIANGGLLMDGYDLVEPASGTRILSLPGMQEIALSPSDRYVATTEAGRAIAGVIANQLCDPGTQERRIHLYDRTTGESRVLHDCSKGSSDAHLIWMADERHLVLWHASCYACESFSARVALLDVQTGASIALTDGLEAHGAPFPSPADDRLLVSGTALRLYTSSGELLRTIAAPEGFDIVTAAWSPEGASFLFVAGPAGFYAYP